MNLYDAIFFRKSIRHFKMEPVEKRILEQILNFTKYLSKISLSHKAEFELLDSIAYKKLAGGAFMVKAPHYLVLSLDREEGSLVYCGYLMEHMALYLVTKGIASCFIEGSNSVVSPRAKAGCFRFAIAFGNTDKGLYKEKRTENRLDLKELCTFKEETDANIMTMLQAARLAPSAMNSQPWRFVVYNNRIHVFMKREKGMIKKYLEIRKVDMGMVLANLMIAAEEVWLDTKIVKREDIAERIFEKKEYLCTVKIDL